MARLASSNYVSVSVAVPSSSTWVKDQFIRLQDTTYLVHVGGTEGETATLVQEANIVDEVEANATFAVGDNVYINPTNQNTANATANGFHLAGTAREAAVSGGFFSIRFRGDR